MAEPTADEVQHGDMCTRLAALIELSVARGTEEGLTLPIIPATPTCGQNEGEPTCRIGMPAAVALTLARTPMVDGIPTGESNTT